MNAPQTGHAPEVQEQQGENDRIQIHPGEVKEFLVEGYAKFEVVLKQLKNGQRAAVLRIVGKKLPEPQITTEAGKDGVYQAQDTGGARFSMAKVQDHSQAPRVVVDATPSPSTFQVRAIHGAERPVVED